MKINVINNTSDPILILVNSYIKVLVQIQWGFSVHGRDLYVVKTTPGPPKKF